MPTYDVVDLFAGPGGWSEAVKRLGLSEVGLEWEHSACQTATAAGHARLRTDVAAYPTAPFAGVRGLIASPPCQSFSRAGNGLGLDDPRGQLTEQVLRWADELLPEWIACEQVPRVLPIWEEYAEHLRARGYSAWTGVLNAAAYGAPQQRRRAVLIASRVREVAAPVPTHSAQAGLLTQPFQTIGEALGYDDDRILIPGSWADGRGGNRRTYRLDEPAPTLHFGHDAAAWKWSTGERLSISDAGVLQGFPVEYPWRGAASKQYQQAGNAIPVQLAEAVLRAVV